MVYLHDKIVAVSGHFDVEYVIGAQLLAVKLAAKNESVTAGRRAEKVQVEQRARLVVARVIEACAIGSKADAVIAGAGQLIVERLAGFHIQEPDGGLVSAALAHAVGQQRSIARDVCQAQRSIGVAA